MLTDTQTDGWIEWHGGECPVDGDAIIDVAYRRGEWLPMARAGSCSWLHYPSGSDIIAYRVEASDGR